MDTIDGKEELIRRIAMALHGREGRGTAPPAEGVPEADRGEEGRVARFRERLESQGGAFLSGTAMEPLLPPLAEALRIYGVTVLFFPADDAGARALCEALVPFGPFSLARQGEISSPAAPTSAGVQTAEFAVAETGTVVQTSGGGKTLLPGLLADVHVALLSPEAFVDRLEDCLDPFLADPPRNISLVTGPSRTADIEQTLTIGAHGPKKVIAVHLPSPPRHP